MKDIIAGGKYVIEGFKLVTKPGIRLYVILPFLFNLFLFAGVIIYGAGQLGNLIDWLSAQWAWLDWISWLLWPLFLIIILTTVFFCFSILANLVAAPFNGFLAESVEAFLTGEKPGNATKLSELPGEIFQAVRAEFKKFLYFLIRAVPLLILFAIPLVNALAPVLWFLFGAWMMALEYLDYPMGNHAMLFPEIRRQLRTKPALSLGFGMVVMVLTMVPVVNFIVMPVAVAGATRLWVERIKTGGPAKNGPATGKEGLSGTS